MGVGKCPSCMIGDCVACWGRGCECEHKPTTGSFLGILFMLDDRQPPDLIKFIDVENPLNWKVIF